MQCCTAILVTVSTDYSKQNGILFSAGEISSSHRVTCKGFPLSMRPHMVTLAKMSSHAAESGSPSEYMAFIRRQPPGVGVLPAAQAGPPR
jgi:hypothetical protein